MSAPPSRTERLMGLVRWGMLVALTALASVSLYRVWGPAPGRGGVVDAPRFYCPMHPQITSSTPGECPICHMALERIPDDRAESSHGAQTHAAEGPARDAAAPSGLATVTLSLDRQQLGGVVSEPARRERGDAALRVAAVVEAPETGRAEARVRAPGFVERVAVRQTGVVVARGEVLAWVYVPQVYQAEQELLAARRWAVDGGARDTEVSQAARQSLDLLGVDARDVDAMLTVGVATRAVPLRAPAGGYVVRTSVALGQYVTPETALYELADLSRVWVVASVWTRDLSRVRVGTVARFAVQGMTALDARVLLVEPSVSAETRAARVRLEVLNPRGALRPGMYGEALFAGVSGEAALTVPRDAVVDTGRERYVFVQRGEDAFEPRVVRMGALQGERWEVLDGVAEGERVVSRGAFMVDSESRLRAALSTRAPSGDGGAP